MNYAKNAFDPSISELFFQQNSIRNTQEQTDSIDGTYLFYSLNQPHQYPDILPLAYEFITLWLKKTEHSDTSSFIQNYSEKKLTSLKTTKMVALPDSYLTQDNLNKCLQQSAPVVLTQPCWLQNTFKIAYSQSKTATQLLSIYLQLTRTNDKGFDLLNSYRSLLLATGSRTPTLYDFSYSHQSDTVQAIFDFAAIQLAFARFPRVLLPEILGFTLAFCQLPTLIEACFPKHQLPPHFFKQRDQRLQMQLPLLQNCISDHLALFPQQKNNLWQRIQNGFFLYQLQMQHCKDQFKKFLEQPLSKNQSDSSRLQVTNILVAKKQVKLSNRDLYHHLLNSDLYPHVSPIAQTKARRLLATCAVFNPLPFKHYSHEQFDKYLDNIYQQELSNYEPLYGKPKISREAYVWGIEQIAPMILIDGCWLQNSLTLQNIHPEICEILFRIYCDEIGNGQLEQNHPHIFQQLLKSLSIKLPPAYSPEFIKHPGFISSAFGLPVYMMSLSSSSVTFLPELLGLNMAIELSGLGKDYKRLVDEWNYWNIDPTIANIHISIDNVASGHTFLAKKAIQLYMDDLFQRTGDKTIWDGHWQRIYTGYASLRFVGGWFKLNLPIWYLSRKFRSKLSPKSATV